MQTGCTQSGDDIAIMWFGKEVLKAGAYHRPHIIDLQQGGFIGGHQCIQIAKVACQIFGRGFAHMANAQAINKARQSGDFAFFQAIQQVLGRFSRHPIQSGQLRQLQVI